MTMELFVPFTRDDGRALKKRRLRISIDNEQNYCEIKEEFKIKDTWCDGRDGYNIVDFPVEKISELANQLQRIHKLLVLK